MDGVVDQITEDFYTCSICMDTFRNPKTLPCLHTYCEECLRDYTESRNFTATGKFPCMLCRVETNIPEGGVGAFPTNFMLQNMLENLRAAEAQAFEQQVQQRLMQQQQQEREQQQRELQRRQEQQQQQQQRYQVDTSENDPNYNNRHQPPPRPSRPPQLQRRVNLAADEFTVPVKQNMHGARHCFGQFGNNLTDFTQPIGIATYDEKYILVSDQRSNRIMIFSPDGKIKTMFTCQGAVQDICIDGTGHVVVANMKAERALAKAYTLSGQSKASYGQQFTYEKPHGIAVSPRHIAVSTLETNKVFLLDQSGRMLKEFGGTGSRNEQFRSPLFVAFTSADDIIVSDSGNNTVKYFNSTAKFKMVLGSKGSRPGQFNKPLGLAVDSENNIYVADAGNHRIQCFNSKGKFVSIVLNGIFGKSAGDDGIPRNIALLGQDKIAVLVTGDRFAEIRVYALNTVSKTCTCQ